MSSSMTPELYEGKRNELVTLLDEVLGLLDNIPVLPANRDKVRDELERTRRRVFENQFTVALMAHFQGGKSTTFNALCDGMEISPRGTQIKTSATVISAQNTIDDNEVGTAEVVWRSERELVLVFGELLFPYLRREHPERFGSCIDIDQLAGIVDFTRDIGALKAALGKEWEQYRRSPADYPSESLDALRIGSIICQYVASGEIRELRQNEHFRIEDIGELVRFPKDWEIRWGDGDAGVFSGRECAFSFIREVRCKVRSENLARTGSVIVDCPGLFASRYDTLVARDILSRVDAVWFLCGGKALGESDLGMLREVVKTRADKPFFTINMSGTTRSNIAVNIRPADIAYLRQQAGLQIEEDEFHLYHALLALCSAQGEKLLSGRLDSHSEAAVKDMYERLNDSVPESVEAAWAETVEDQFNALKIPERKGFPGLDRKGVDMVRSASGITEIVSAIEREVIRRKAGAILVRNGAGRIERELRGFEGELKAVEHDAALTASQAKSEYEKAEKALNEFHAFVHDEMKKSHFFDNFIDTELAKDYREKVLVAAVDGAAKKAGTEVANMKKRWVFLGPKEDDVKTALLRHYRDEVEALTMLWHSETQSGKNKLFAHLLQDKLDELGKKIRERWNQLTENVVRLQGLPEPDLSDIIKISPESIDDVQGSKTAADRKDVLLLSGQFLTGAAIGFLLGGPLGVGVAIVAGAVIQALFVKTPEQIRDDTINLVRKNYNKALEENQLEQIERLASQLSHYRNHCVANLNALLGEQSTQLESMRARALADLERKEFNRATAADMCKEIRTNKIEPVRLRLGKFLQSLVEYMPGEFEEVDCERT